MRKRKNLAQYPFMSVKKHHRVYHQKYHLETSLIDQTKLHYLKIFQLEISVVQIQILSLLKRITIKQKVEFPNQKLLN